MSKAIEGAAMLGGAVLMGVAAFMDPALIASPFFDKIWASLIIGGIAMEAGAIAGALTSNRGTNITTRQAAAFRQVVYGEQRVGGVMVYESTTGSHHDQYNYVIVLAGHPCESILNLYLDGRVVHWNPTNMNGNQTFPDGTNWGGAASGGQFVGPGGQNYNFDNLVYAEAYMGNQTSAPNTTPGGGFSTGLQANDPDWAPTAEGTPYLGGCTYMYLKVEYDTNMFPSSPEIRVTLRGKNNIMDPRTGTAGYTTNWALIVADVLQDTQFGLGDVGNVNTAQLIAAANVCDEQVALAAGGTEARYSCHWHYDTSTDPGNALSTMMPAAAGRLSQIGGQWYIWPAYWQGPSFTFDENALTGPITWNPNRSLRDLFNRVNGTYIAPNFPYNTAGNLYDSNGWFDGTLDNTFPFGFTPTNYPQYACDTLHGYASDEYLADDGKPLPHELTQSCVLSVAQSQRVGKIVLQRNRQQGSGTFPMNLAAYEMQPCSVMQFSFAAMGWTEKYLEISSTALKLDDGSGSDGVPSLRVTHGVQETAETVYEWSTAEELTVYDVPANPQQAPYTPAPPTGMTLTSGAATAVQTADGVVHPRIEVQWTVPLDILTKQVQVQYAPTATPAPWIDNGLVDVGNTVAYITGVVAGQQYNVRIRGLRANGAASAWEEIDGYTVSLTLSVVGIVALAPGSLVALAFPDGTAEIIVSPFTAQVGSVGVAVLPAGPYDLTGLAQSTLYFVYYVDPTFAGGAITPIATTNSSDFLNKPGYFLIDSIVTPYAGSSGSPTGRYSPSTFSSSGTQTPTNPANAYDGSLATYASIGSSFTYIPGEGPAPTQIRHTTAQVVYSGFPNVTLSSGATLNVVAAISISGGTATASMTASGAVTGTLGDPTATQALQTYTLDVPAGTNLSTLQVNIAPFVTGATTGTTVEAYTSVIQVYEIYVQ